MSHELNVMNVKDHEEQEDMGMKRRMTQFATFIVHCGKHIQRRKHGFCLTHVR